MISLKQYTVCGNHRTETKLNECDRYEIIFNKFSPSRLRRFRRYG